MRVSEVGGTSRCLRRALGRAALAACALTPAVVPAQLHAQAEALTLSEVLDLRRRGVSTRQILRNAQQYCVAFTVTDSVERALLASGADSVLVGGIRKACIVAPPSVESLSGVLLDDNFAAASTLGRLAASDRLCTVNPADKGMRIDNRRPELGCAIAYPFEVGDGDVRIELTMTELGRDGRAAAVFGFGKSNASWEQYSFRMTADNHFELCAGSDGACRRLLFDKRRASPSPVPPADSRMAVEIRRREILLYINDERVGAYLASRPVTGGLSVGVGPRTTAVFNRLVVRRLDGLASSQR